jgi:acyl transferase domain-containing protein
MPASMDTTNESRTSASRSRSSQRKRRRRGIVLPAFFVAVVLVAVIAVAAKVTSPNGSGANSLAQVIDSLPQSGSVALIVQERKNLIVMDDAVRTLTVASKPATANLSQVIASQSAAANSSSSSTSVTTAAQPPDPGTAQSIGYNMLPTFGFSQKTQWTCLLDLWNRESGWMYDAENPSSGAYGIPQALPGYKMAAAGTDWQTNPATQIKWGLTYISQTYGTPCAAWNFELANNGY